MCENEPLDCFPGMEDSSSREQVKYLLRYSRAIITCAGQAACVSPIDAKDATQAADILLACVERMLLNLPPDVPEFNE